MWPSDATDVGQSDGVTEKLISATVRSAMVGISANPVVRNNPKNISSDTVCQIADLILSLFN